MYACVCVCECVCVRASELESYNRPISKGVKSHTHNLIYAAEDRLVAAVLLVGAECVDGLQQGLWRQGHHPVQQAQQERYHQLGKGHIRHRFISATTHTHTPPGLIPVTNTHQEGGFPGHPNCTDLFICMTRSSAEKTPASLNGSKVRW